MDGYAEPTGHKSHDLISGQRRTAFCKFDGTVVDPLDHYAVRGVHPLDLHRNRLWFRLPQLLVFLFYFGQKTRDLQAAVSNGGIHFLY